MTPPESKVGADPLLCAFILPDGNKCRALRSSSCHLTPTTCGTPYFPCQLPHHKFVPPPTSSEGA